MDFHLQSRMAVFDAVYGIGPFTAATLSEGTYKGIARSCDDIQRAATLILGGEEIHLEPRVQLMDQMLAADVPGKLATVMQQALKILAGKQPTKRALAQRILLRVASTYRDLHEGLRRVQVFAKQQ